MSHQKVWHFNSIKVRLELKEVIPGDKFKLFQFHKGTIRTQKGLTLLQQNINFNSIKVRLERRATTMWSLRILISIP